MDAAATPGFRAPSPAAAQVRQRECLVHWCSISAQSTRLLTEERRAWLREIENEENSLTIAKLRRCIQLPSSSSAASWLFFLLLYALLGPCKNNCRSFISERIRSLSGTILFLDISSSCTVLPLNPPNPCKQNVNLPRGVRGITKKQMYHLIRALTIDFSFFISARKSN